MAAIFFDDDSGPLGMMTKPNGLMNGYAQSVAFCSGASRVGGCVGAASPEMNYGSSDRQRQ
ncbi:MAG: hypothetical protein AAF528_00780 [Cyanobacteria bacterium P01_C01_bin.121]